MSYSWREPRSSVHWAVRRWAPTPSSLRAAMNTARWTGPMLASTAETLPKGHFYTEPYFFDVIIQGNHHPGSSGFYQYGLLDNLTVGIQPNFATATNRIDRGMAIGDFKLLSQVRLTHFTPDHRVPTIALALNEVIPTGRFDRLGPTAGRAWLGRVRDRGRGQRPALDPAEERPAASCADQRAAALLQSVRESMAGASMGPTWVSRAMLGRARVRP